MNLGDVPSLVSIRLGFDVFYEGTAISDDNPFPWVLRFLSGASRLDKLESIIIASWCYFDPRLIATGSSDLSGWRLIDSLLGDLGNSKSPLNAVVLQITSSHMIESDLRSALETLMPRLASRGILDIQITEVFFNSLDSDRSFSNPNSFAFKSHVLQEDDWDENEEEEDVQEGENVQVEENVQESPVSLYGFNHHRLRRGCVYHLY